MTPCALFPFLTETVEEMGAINLALASRDNLYCIFGEMLALEEYGQASWTRQERVGVPG